MTLRNVQIKTATISLCLKPNSKHKAIMSSLSIFTTQCSNFQAYMYKYIDNKSCAHEIISRAHEIISRDHEIISRDHEIISRAHEIIPRDNDISIL